MDLKQRRQELGLTLEEVGEACGVGKSTVRKWETGAIKNMRRDKVLLLAKKLQVDPMLIIDGVDAPAAPSSDEDEDVEMSASNAGDGMNQRLKELRKTLGLSQQEFSERINVAQSTYAQICNTFSVSEKWIRTGEGEMLVKESDSLVDQLCYKYGFDSISRTLLEVFLELPDEQRKTIMDIARRLTDHANQQEAEEEKEETGFPGRLAAADIKKPPRGMREGGKIQQ